MSVFGGFVAIVVCVAAAIIMMSTQGKVDREGEGGKGGEQEGTNMHTIYSE